MKAYVTLLTNESYLAGALLLAKTLKGFDAANNVAILVDRGAISEESFALVEKAFDDVVDITESAVSAPLKKVSEQLGRPELASALSKILVWKVFAGKYDLVLFLDADTLVVQSIAHLFEKHKGLLPSQIVAVPDAGWPDVFNSGVFLAKPNAHVFEDLVEASKDPQKSFDGADQGLLNEYFNIGSDGQNWTRAPFLFNVTTNLGQHYEYQPAFVRFFDQIHVLHFIGGNKPWHSQNGILGSDTANYHHLWWVAFNKQFSQAEKSQILAICKPKGEAHALEFSKYENAWDTVKASSSRPWIREDAPTPTRIFNYTINDAYDHDHKISKTVQKLHGLKFKEPKKYEWGTDEFNPDKSLDEVAKIPLKFMKDS